jgi:beta-galactosidase
MKLLPKLPNAIAYGGDYNPEQWDPSVWQEDVRLMREAGVNLVSLAIFSWAKLQPNEKTYEFGWLDQVMDLLAKNGILVCLATATGSPPPWLSVKYPDVLPVDASGLALYHGSRQHYSPSSPTYQRFAAELVRQLAERYRAHPALAAWHVNNEYACHTGECHSPDSSAAFRRWLQKKYGTLDQLNAAWGTAFWSQIYQSWDEVFTPRRAPHDRNPTQQLDFRRFTSDAFLGLYRMEKAILNELTPAVPATTNLVWFIRAIDVRSWAPDLDFISWDCYPDPLTGNAAQHFAAVGHDLMRSLKKNQPFMLIEQAPSAVTWRAINPPKGPGVMRLWSLQALARGADGVMFFQWRASQAGAEKYITGMVGHGDPAQSRVFAEIKALGAELLKLAPLVGSTVHSRVAIIFDWPVCWALELEAKPARLDYPGWATELHRYFYERNIPVDFIRPDAALDDYALVVAPALYLLTQADAANLEQFVQRGGTLLATFFSGIVDENEHVVLGGYPGYLRRVLGLRVEEWIPFGEGRGNTLQFEATGKSAPVTQWAEVVHLEGATSLARYTGDFYAGGPAITEHAFGRGTAYYLSTKPDNGGLVTLLDQAVAKAGVQPVLSAPSLVEATLRERGGERYLSILNHMPAEVLVPLAAYHGTDLITGTEASGHLTLAPRGVAVLRLHP